MGSTEPGSDPPPPIDERDERADIPQYSGGKIFAVWAAAAVPMALLAWIVAPALADRIGGPNPLVKSLLALLTAGLIWQFALVVILTRQELGTLRWSQVRRALWLLPPRNPSNGRVGGRVWWWVLPFILLFALEEMLPDIAGPSSRDFGPFLESPGGQAFFSGAWGWYAVVIAFTLFNTVLGEELLFRGLLLPRMRGVFGRWDWVANGVLFALYHLHTPWVIPTALVDIFALSYPSRRFQSAWMGIVVHSAQSVFILIAVGILVAG